MPFKDPENVLDQFIIGHGRIVADFGVGSGAYALPVARRVGDTGRVYAIDIQKHLLERIKNEAARARLHNVDIIWGNIEKRGGTTLKEESVDAVIVSNVLFQTEDKGAVAREAYRILKKGGRVLAVDWSDSFGALGPSPEFVFPQNEAKKIFEDTQFMYERDINAGEHHYGMVFRKT